MIAIAPPKRTDTYTKPLMIMTRYRRVLQVGRCCTVPYCTLRNILLIEKGFLLKSKSKQATCLSLGGTFRDGILRYPQ